MSAWYVWEVTLASGRYARWSDECAAGGELVPKLGRRCQGSVNHLLRICAEKLATPECGELVPQLGCRTLQSAKLFTFLFHDFRRRFFAEFAG